MRPTICSHSRKSWNCLLCKTENAQPKPLDKIQEACIKEALDLTAIASPCPVPPSMIPEKYSRMKMLKWGEYRKGGMDSYRIAFKCDNNKIHIWHIPKAAVDRKKRV